MNGGTLIGLYKIQLRMSVRVAILLLLIALCLSSECFQGCFQCDPQSQMCSACYQGFQLTIMGGCAADTIPHCNLYLSADQCMRCSPTYRLQNNACQRDYSGCLSNLTSLECSQCDKGLTLALGVCHGALNCEDYTTHCHKCQPGFNEAGGICIASDQNCKSTHPHNGVCLECQDSYDLVGYKCVPRSVFNPNCEIYDEMGRCYICKEGYVLEQTVCLGQQEIQKLREDGLVESVVEQFISVREHSIESGQAYQQKSSDTQSQQPVTTHNLVSQPVSITEPVTWQHSQPVSVTPHIVHPPPSVNHYEPSENQAYEAVQKLVNTHCKDFDDSRNCLECYPSYFINTKGICYPIDPFCKQFNHTLRLCQGCYPGYQLLNYQCVIAKKQPRDPHCKEFQGDDCAQCYDHYHIKNRFCVPDDPLCKESNYDGRCLECYEGYLLQQGSCVSSPDSSNIFDPFCTYVEHSVCQQCANGYFVDPLTKECKALSLDCIRHDLDTGACLQCLPAYVHVLGKCVLKRESCTSYTQQGCSSCESGHFLKRGLCYKNDVTCATYDYQGNCGQCVQTYYLINGECVFPALGFDPHCSKYVNSYCTECKPGSYLVNFRCRVIDENCSRFDIIKKKCLECVNGLNPKGQFCV